MFPLSSAIGVFLVVLAEPVLAVIVLWIAHDGVDVIELLRCEFDESVRTEYDLGAAVA